MRIPKFLKRTGAALALACALPSAAHAQLFYSEPQLERGPIDSSDAVLAQQMPNATPAEVNAGLVWMLRSALNVAALQCQFSRYLRTVDNYNATIDHHAEELASAYTTLGNYFRRVGGQREGQRRFDAWSTNLYQQYSTSHAQIIFCQTASNIGKEALARPRGEFGAIARDRMREIRSSLRPVRDRILASTTLTLDPIPASVFTAPDCSRLRGRQRRACEQR